MNDPAEGARRVLVLGDTAAAVALAERLGAAVARRVVGAPSARDLALARSGALVVDAAHPFDAPLSQRGPALSALSEDRRLRLSRKPWTPGANDDWRVARDEAAAAARLEPRWRRVFLTLGRDRLGPFAQDADLDRRYLVRIRGGGAPPWPRAEVSAGRGPFSVDDEAALMSAQRVDALVTRNAGGEAAFPKVAAAARLGLPVVMLAQPAADPPVVWDVDGALDWLSSRTRG